MNRAQPSIERDVCNQRDGVEVRMLVRLLDLPERVVAPLLAELNVPCWEYHGKAYTSRRALRELFMANGADRSSR